MQKGTKESKISLGSWLAVWEAIKMCNFIAEFKSLKNEKINYLMSKLQIYDLATCKNEFLHLDLSLKDDILYEISDLSNKTLRN